jgi:hypothetical protein
MVGIEAIMQQDVESLDEEYVLDAYRMRREHITAGYRDGVSDGREALAQSGFDEAFPLGSHIGVRAGEIRGLINALCDAIGTCSEFVMGERKSELRTRVEDWQDMMIVSSCASYCLQLQVCDLQSRRMPFAWSFLWELINIAGSSRDHGEVLPRGFHCQPHLW